MTTLGFIVHMYDPVNYEISFDLDQTDKSIIDNDKMTDKVLTNTYHYFDYQNENAQLFPLTPYEKSGTTYRCRMKGVGVYENRSEKNMRKAYIELSRIFDALEGWVHCTLHEVDQYSRLLINMENPVTGEDINDVFFLNKYRDTFYHYYST